MCRWGDEVVLDVPMPADLSHTGSVRWAEKGIDRCLAPLIADLNAAGIWTANSCCGHGRAEGSIVLHDGRELTIEAAARLLPEL